MSIPAKSYSTTGLKMNPADVNPWYVATFNYSECVRSYFTTFINRTELEEELNRADINNVCKKELNDLKSLVGDIRYKEVLGLTTYGIKNDFFEELAVKYRK